MNATTATKRPTGRTSSAVIVERSAPAGHMSPLHRRDEVETYHVLEGRLTFYVGRDAIPAGPGDLVIAPAGAERTVRAQTSARWLVQTTVTSLERYADFGRAMTQPLPGSTRGWPSADELAAVSAIAAANGIELVGPPGALPRR